MLLLTLRGTPTMYYGDEIGMHVDHSARACRILWRKTSRALAWGAIPSGRRCSGIHCQRGVLEWNAVAAIDSQHLDRTVATLRDNPASILSLYRNLADLKRKYAALNIGAGRC